MFMYASSVYNSTAELLVYPAKWRRIFPSKHKITRHERLQHQTPDTKPSRHLPNSCLPQIQFCRYLKFSDIHLHIPILATIKMLEKIAALEVLVGMYDGFELCHGHDALVLGASDLVLVNIFKDP